MSTFETPPASQETASSGGAKDTSSQKEGFTPAEKESLKKLDAQLNPEVESTDTEVTPENLGKLREVLREDIAKLRETVEKSQKDFQKRLEAYQKEHEGVKTEKVRLEDLYSKEEISVLKKEAEKSKESWINWGFVWKGAKIVGGVLIAAAIGGAIGYGLYSALKALGYGPAMLSLTNKVLGAANTALDQVNKGLTYVKDGLDATWENIKSWSIWTHFSSSVDKGTGDILKRAGDAAEKVVKKGNKVFNSNALFPLSE